MKSKLFFKKVQIHFWKYKAFDFINVFVIYINRILDKITFSKNFHRTRVLLLFVFQKKFVFQTLNYLP